MWSISTYANGSITRATSISDPKTIIRYIIPTDMSTKHKNLVKIRLVYFLRYLQEYADFSTSSKKTEKLQFLLSQSLGLVDQSLLDCTRCRLYTGYRRYQSVHRYCDTSVHVVTQVYGMKVGQQILPENWGIEKKRIRSTIYDQIPIMLKCRCDPARICCYIHLDTFLSCAVAIQHSLFTMPSETIVVPYVLNV